MIYAKEIIHDDQINEERTRKRTEYKENHEHKNKIKLQVVIHLYYLIHGLIAALVAARVCANRARVTQSGKNEKTNQFCYISIFCKCGTLHAGV